MQIAGAHRFSAVDSAQHGDRHWFLIVRLRGIGDDAPGCVFITLEVDAVDSFSVSGAAEIDDCFRFLKRRAIQDDGLHRFLHTLDYENGALDRLSKRAASSIDAHHRLEPNRRRKNGDCHCISEHGARGSGGSHRFGTTRETEFADEHRFLKHRETQGRGDQRSSIGGRPESGVFAAWRL